MSYGVMAKLLEDLLPVRKGASLAAIMRQGCWSAEKMVLEYIEAGQRFEDNAVNVLLEPC